MISTEAEKREMNYGLFLESMRRTCWSWKSFFIVTFFIFGKSAVVRIVPGYFRMFPWTYCWVEVSIDIPL